MKNVRERLQRMEFFTTLSPITVKKSGLLSNEGLPKIIENRVQGVDFPLDIRSDADLLFRKWISGQIDPHIPRGIVTKKGTGKQETTSMTTSHGKKTGLLNNEGLPTILENGVQRVSLLTEEEEVKSYRYNP